jgi:hypothetical protein
VGDAGTSESSGRVARCQRHTRWLLERVWGGHPRTHDSIGVHDKYCAGNVISGLIVTSGIPILVMVSIIVRRSVDADSVK